MLLGAPRRALCLAILLAGPVSGAGPKGLSLWLPKKPKAAAPATPPAPAAPSGAAPAESPREATGSSLPSSAPAPAADPDPLPPDEASSEDLFGSFDQPSGRSPVETSIFPVVARKAARGASDPAAIATSGPAPDAAPTQVPEVSPGTPGTQDPVGDAAPRLPTEAVTPTATSDAFAADRELTAALVQLLGALGRQDRPDPGEAQSDLGKAVRAMAQAMQTAQAHPAGPLTEVTPEAREIVAALLVPKFLAMQATGGHAAMAAELKEITQGGPRFTAQDLAGIPMVDRGDPTRKLVALTFDDGPEAGPTERVLEVLARFGAKATFFVVGQQVDRFPHLVRRIVAEGHELGQHSYTHPKLTSLPAARIRDEIERTDAALARAVPEVEGVRFFRLPYQIGNRSRLVQGVLAERFEYLIDWSCDSQDYQEIGPDQITARVLKGGLLQNGAIVLFHDRRPHTAAALERILPKLLESGRKPATVSQVMGIDPAGSRVQKLAKALELVVAGRTEDAAQALGRFTLENPTSAAAPAALYGAYLAAVRAGRPKAPKLKEALLRRYPDTVFGLALEGAFFPGHRFVPGGAKPRPAKPDPPAVVASVPAAASVPAVPLPELRPLPPVRSTTRTLARARPRPPPSPPTPLAPPYKDPRPSLDGSHMVDPFVTE